jgi:HPt (histidine-containing phosphotransfer) domain-containing protein
MSAAADRTRTAQLGAQSAAWTVDALRSVWEHQQSRVSERIGVIELAIKALADDRLGSDLRDEAQRAAHMLAGSLGMFGFILAADAARGLESELAHPRIDRAPALSGLLARVRAGVRGPVVLCSERPAEEAADGKLG